MQIDKTQFPDVLTFEDVEDVLNLVDPQKLEILTIHRHNVSGLDFGSQMASSYRNVPLIYQPGAIRTRAQCLTDWKNKFIIIFGSARAQFLLAKIKAQSIEIARLADFENWQDETTTQSEASGVSSTVSGSSGIATNVTGSVLNSDQEARQTDQNSAEEIAEVSAPGTGPGPHSGDAYTIATPNFKTVNKNKDLTTGLVSSDSQSKSAATSVGNNSNKSRVIFSNTSKDIREFFETDLNNYHSQFLYLFRDLFRWRPNTH